MRTFGLARTSQANCHHDQNFAPHCRTWSITADPLLHGIGSPRNFVQLAAFPHGTGLLWTKTSLWSSVILKPGVQNVFTISGDISIMDMQIKYGLPYCVTCPYEYGSRVPKPGYEAQPSTLVVGSRDPYDLVCVIAQVLENCFHTGILCQREAVWVAVESRDLWSWALHPTHYYYNYQYFCIQQVLVGLSCSFPINYTSYKPGNIDEKNNWRKIG